MHHVAMALAAQTEAGVNTQQRKYLWTTCTNMSVNRNRGREQQWSTWGHYLQLNAGVTPLWFWTNLFVLKIKRLSSQMDQSGTLRCRIPGRPEEWLPIVWPSSRSAAAVHAQTHRQRCRRTPSYTQKQSQPQRASVGSAGVTSGQRRIVASLGRSWTLDSASIHLLVVSQKQRAARTASVTNNTCLHTSALLCSRAPGCKDMATKKMES